MKIRESYSFDCLPARRAINCLYMSIILSGVSFRYSDQPPLFERVNLSVASGRKISVIGNNGTGKSTLLQLISGRLQASSGSVSCACTPYYLPQQIGITGISVGQALNVSDKIEALHAIYAGSDQSEHYELLADDWSIESRCRMALDAWGLPHIEWTASIDSLSGGEKTKLFLAGISVHQPAIILLDEPTNHLDDTSRQKLYEFIVNSKATLIAVSHDSTLLNLLQDTYELTPKGLKLYGGNYDFYKIQKEIETRALANQIDAGETALRLARKKAKEVGERQEKRSRQGEKNKDQIPRILRQSLKNSAEKTSTKLKDKHTERIDRQYQKLGELRQKQSPVCELKLDFDNTLLHQGKVLVSARNINFQYEAKELLWRNPLHLEIRSGERIHLKGDNGSGKTSFLKLLIGELMPSTGEITKADFSFVYLDQAYSSVETGRTLLELAQEHNRFNLPDHEVKLRLHRALFPKEMWNKPCQVLSGGERMRLCLCCLMISNHIPDLFILDEPTNNLDLASLAILTSTIKNYQGALLVVSHDRQFVEEIGITKVVEIEASSFGPASRSFPV